MIFQKLLRSHFSPLALAILRIWSAAYTPFASSWNTHSMIFASGSFGAMYFLPSSLTLLA
ncbi:hypothetical protein [Rufibacter sp. LB8]|uniref:hypothetical protein n=1 Tax=Rufibacter sp. LB8 TaxID=2777781 RepID=UPI002105954E|nr:hypothetical protein [Rufibacter sp. LB8]